MVEHTSACAVSDAVSGRMGKAVILYKIFSFYYSLVAALFCFNLPVAGVGKPKRCQRWMAVAALARHRLLSTDGSMPGSLTGCCLICTAHKAYPNK